MPSPKHPCAEPNCSALVARKEAAYCRRHAALHRSPEHIAKITARNRGRKQTIEARRHVSEARIRRFGYDTSPRACGYCGKTFTPSKPSSTVRFCSPACGYANRSGERAPGWRADMPLTECRVCGKMFRLPAASLIDKRFTCSYQCKNIWQKTHQARRATNIERAMAAALASRGMTYQEQVGLCNVATVDFYLPATRTVVFCDGDYWHSLPDHVERDQRQTVILEAAGYRVFRFLGSEILADVAACVSRLESPIGL